MTGDGKGVMWLIYTEDINREETKELLAEYFPCCTVSYTEGLWEKQWEKSLEIKVLCSQEEANTTGAKVRELAEQIKRLNSQAAVLIQRLDNHAWLV